MSEFYVHAVLQAARASFLGLELGAAKSWPAGETVMAGAATSEGAA